MDESYYYELNYQQRTNYLPLQTPHLNRNAGNEFREIVIGIRINSYEDREKYSRTLVMIIAVAVKIL